MIIRADILIMSVLHAESSRYSAKLYKAQPFIQMTRMGIGRYHCIELQHAKALCFSLLKAVLYKLLPDMQPSRIGLPHSLHCRYVRTVLHCWDVKCIIRKSFRCCYPQPPRYRSDLQKIPFLSEWSGTLPAEMLLHPLLPDSRCG